MENIFVPKLLKSFNTDLLELIRNRRGCYKFWLQRNWANKHLYCWSFPLLLRHESWSKSCVRRSCGLIDFVMHQSIPPPPGLLRGICLPCQSPLANFALPGGRAFANPRAILLAGYYTEGFTGKKADWLIKDRNKLKRVVKACSRFYACISSLLIKLELLFPTAMKTLSHDNIFKISDFPITCSWAVCHLGRLYTLNFK